MGIKIIEISNCYSCPNFRLLKDRDTELDWCRVLGKSITPVASVYILGTIPVWCPLPSK